MTQAINGCQFTTLNIYIYIQQRLSHRKVPGLPTCQDVAQSLGASMSWRKNMRKPGIKKKNTLDKSQQPKST